MDVLLPFPVDAPAGIRVLLWDGTGAPPAGLDDVVFFSPPHGDDAALTLAGALPSLRHLQVLSAGVDTVRDRVPEGVELCNGKGVHDPATAELAVTLMLASLRRLPEHARAADRSSWDPTAADGAATLTDAVVLLVGYGSIGAAVERRVQGFEPAEILRVARRARDDRVAPVAALEALPSLLPRADVVVLTVPLTAETRGMVDKEFLAAMKDGALLVNVARGPVVDTAALLAELDADRLRAALDVTDPEPLPADSGLWHAPGVVLTPHVGGAAPSGQRRARRLLEDQLQRLAAVQPLLNVVSGAY